MNVHIVSAVILRGSGIELPAIFRMLSIEQAGEPLHPKNPLTPPEFPAKVCSS
jgi:hypothetical protein